MSVLAVIEQIAGDIHKMSWECVAGAQEAAGGLGEPLIGVVLGSGVDAVAAQVARKRCDEVVVLDHELLEPYTSDGFTAALGAAVTQLRPSLALFPHTYQVRDYAPKLAASLGKGFVSDAVALRVSEGQVVFIRQLFQGRLHADVVAEGPAPHFGSLQAGAYRPEQAADGDAPAPVRRIEVAVEASNTRVRPGERFREAAGDVDLSSAERVVSVGRGIGEADNIELARKLAAALGAELAASRPICDNGWLPLERQVGSSGQSVAPKLYLALGISGAIQHVVGMKGSRTIVAINKDESAPIFEIADYGIVGDLFEVVPKLIEELKK